MSIKRFAQQLAHKSPRYIVAIVTVRGIHSSTRMHILAHECQLQKDESMLYPQHPKGTKQQVLNKHADFMQLALGNREKSQNVRRNFSLSGKQTTFVHPGIFHHSLSKHQGRLSALIPICAGRAVNPSTVMEKQTGVWGLTSLRIFIQEFQIREEAKAVSWIQQTASLRPVQACTT